MTPPWYCDKCGKEVGIGDSSWCDQCKQTLCTDCSCRHHGRPASEVAAILHTAIYYGVPSQGHLNCANGITGREVSRYEPDIEKKHCVACGKPLIKENKLWFITYYNPEGQVSGPIIATVSKIKPTRAAQMGTETYIPTFTIRQATDKERDEWIEENGYLG